MKPHELPHDYQPSAEWNLGTSNELCPTVIITHQGNGIPYASWQEEDEDTDYNMEGNRKLAAMLCRVILRQHHWDSTQVDIDEGGRHFCGGETLRRNNDREDPYDLPGDKAMNPNSLFRRQRSAQICLEPVRNEYADHVSLFFAGHDHLRGFVDLLTTNGLEISIDEDLNIPPAMWPDGHPMDPPASATLEELVNLVDQYDQRKCLELGFTLPALNHLGEATEPPRQILPDTNKHRDLLEEIRKALQDPDFRNQLQEIMNDEPSESA